MESQSPDTETIKLALEDVRRVMDKQKEERQLMLTQVNILFAVNTALISLLTVGKLLTVFSLFSVGEIAGFILNFSLLINALLPRQFIVSPNLKNTDLLETYLAMSPEQYKEQVLSDFIETYNDNQQRLNDISQSLFYATCLTGTVALVSLLHRFAVYFIPELQQL